MKLPADIKEKFDWVVSFMTVKDRFCFQVLAMMDKIPDASIPTMGVRPTAIGVELRFNPEFVRQMEIEELRYVLTHEVFHVVFHHITKRAPTDPQENQLFNIAADLAINSLIKDDYPNGDRYAPRYKEDFKHPLTGEVLAKKGDIMGVFPGTEQYPFDAELSQENYVHLLRDQQQEQEEQDSDCPVHGEGAGGGAGQGEGDQEEEGEGDQEGDGGQGDGDPEEGEGSGHSHGESGKQCTCKSHGGVGSFDDHGGWEPNEIVDEKIRRKIDTIEKSNGWGSLPGGMIEKIKAAQRSEVPWRKLLKHYLGQLITTDRDPTYKKPNKRFGYPYCGTKHRSMDRKLVAIDTSGSVGTKELEKFLVEINGLAQVQPVDLMLFDTELQYKKAMPFNKKQARYDFKGRGGTAFTPVFKYAKEHRYKSLIVLTDGYAEAVDKPRGMDVIWVLTPDGQCPVDWGKVVKVKKIE
jgi:predicted metal-dependent peptidase